MSSSPSAKSIPAVHSFVLRIEDGPVLNQAVEDALFEAGCNDALLSSCDGKLQLAFDREADSMLAAIVSAIENVESCGLGLKVREVIPTEAAEIAKVNAALRLRDVAPDLLRRLTT